MVISSEFLSALDRMSTVAKILVWGHSHVKIWLVAVMRMLVAPPDHLMLEPSSWFWPCQARLPADVPT